MAGKPQLTPEELVAVLEQCRALGDVTFTEACRAIGVPQGSLRYQLERVVPQFAKDYPQFDWTLPQFAGRPANQLGITDKMLSDENAKLRDQVRDLRSQLASVDREMADHRFVKERLFQLVDQAVAPPDWLVKPKRSSKSPGIPLTMWSDWHWAEVVEPAQVNGVNAYNLEIAQARVRRLVERTITLLRHHMVHPQYEGIVVNLGGDMLSGNIHEELVSTNAVPIMAAVVDLWGVLEWALKALAEEFGRVAVFCVTGNHGRDTKKIQAKDRAFTSFDWLVYAHLQHVFRKDKRVTIVAPQAPDILYAVYDHRFLLTHGDQFRGGDGMIGHIGPVKRGHRKKLARNSEIGHEFDCMIHGHFHSYSPGDRIIGNGSLIGYNEYAASGNFEFELPRQALWITNPQHGITYHLPVYVDEPKTPQEATKWVSWMEAA